MNYSRVITIYLLFMSAFALASSGEKNCHPDAVPDNLKNHINNTSDIVSKIETKVKKVADGTAAYCRDDNDVYSTQTGVYMLIPRKIETNKETGNVDLTVVVAFVKCKKVEGEYKFVKHAPYEPYEYQGPAGKVTAKASDVRIKSYRDGVYDLVHNIELKEPAVQELKLSFPIEAAMNDQQKRKLYRNGSGNGEIDFFIARQMQYQREGSDKIMKDVANLGNFRIPLEVRKTVFGYQVSIR